MRRVRANTESQELWNCRRALPARSQVPIVRQVRPVRQVRHSLHLPCALRKVLRQPTVPTSAPCALEFPEHIAHTAKCHKSYRAYKAYRAYSGIARTLCIAQCALPVFRRLESPSGRQPTTCQRVLPAEGGAFKKLKYQPRSREYGVSRTD